MSLPAAAPRPARPHVAIMQPYLWPAPVYFHLVHAADIFVFFDDVQFVRRRWTHRNRIAPQGDALPFTVPLDGASQTRRLTEIGLHDTEFPRWRRKFLTTLAQGYGDAPGAAPILEEVEALLAAPAPSIADLAARSVEWAAGRLGLRPRWLRASDLDYDRSGGGQDKILSICDRLGAAAYVNAPGGRALYAGAAFAARDLPVYFVEPGGLRPDLAPLSILHALLTEPPACLKEIVETYTLGQGDPA